MEPKEETIIREWNDSLPNDIDVRITISDHKRSDEFKAFQEKFSHLAPKVHFKLEKDDTGQLPAIHLTQNIRFHIIPVEKELEPFLEAMNLLTKPIAQTDKSIKKINIPARLKLYVALQCSFCPEAVHKLIPLAMESQFIKLSIFDAALFEDLAKTDDIRSIPTILLDDQYRWTADPPIQDIVNMMIHRDLAKLSASSIESMLNEGEAEQAADMMIKHGFIFPAFIDLLTHEKWSVRLGAMVAMESIVEKKPDLASQASQPLWDRMQEVDDSIKGDILYTLGTVADTHFIPKLESILDASDNKELKEAAQEAIESIQQKQSSTDASCEDEEEGTCSLPDFLK